MKRKITKAVIPAAGMGTRLLPATKSQPKEMLPVVDRPVMHYVVNEALSAGLDDILIITGKHKRSIEDYFDTFYELENHLKKSGKEKMLERVREISNMADIHYVRQKEPKGLGDSIRYAKKHVGDNPFVLLLGDTITRPNCTKELIDLYQKYEKSITAVEKVPEDKVNLYGVISGEKGEDNVYQIDDLIEKPPVDEAPSNLAILGRYLLTPNIFDALEEVGPGKGGDVQLTDALRLIDEQYAYYYEGTRYDIGNKKDYIKTTIDLAIKEELGEELKEWIKDNYFRGD